MFEIQRLKAVPLSARSNGHVLKSKTTDNQAEEWRKASPTPAPAGRSRGSIVYRGVPLAEQLPIERHNSAPIKKKNAHLNKIAKAEGRGNAGTRARSASAGRKKPHSSQGRSVYATGEQEGAILGEAWGSDKIPTRGSATPPPSFGFGANGNVNGGAAYPLAPAFT